MEVTMMNANNSLGGSDNLGGHSGAEHEPDVDTEPVDRRERRYRETREEILREARRRRRAGEGRRQAASYVGRHRRSETEKHCRRNC